MAAAPQTLTFSLASSKGKTVQREMIKDLHAQKRKGLYPFQLIMQDK